MDNQTYHKANEMTLFPMTIHSDEIEIKSEQQPRVQGKYATELQKAKHEAKMWKQQSQMLLSVQVGQAKMIRMLNEEINRLKWKQATK